MASGIILFVFPSTRAPAPDFPRGAALWRVCGVTVGLVVIALGIPYLGFAVTGTLTMLILLRTVEQTNWPAALALAVASVAAVMWLFGHLLGMALPRGPWGF
jgi:putative tricarboxylic transport membrane protein